jgi:pyruvate,water dikinase
MGSVLSHGAVVAREYKLPAVVNIPEITKILPDGAQVTVDGTRGVILIHS